MVSGVSTESGNCKVFRDRLRLVFWSGTKWGNVVARGTVCVEWDVIILWVEFRVDLVKF